MPCKWLAVVVFSASFSLSAAERLELHHSDSDPWVRLHTAATDSGVYHLESTRNLVEWLEIATTHDGLIRFPDPAATNWAHQFYRFRVEPRSDTNDWKNQIHFP